MKSAKNKEKTVDKTPKNNYTKIKNYNSKIFIQKIVSKKTQCKLKTKNIKREEEYMIYKNNESISYYQ